MRALIGLAPLTLLFACANEQSDVIESKDEAEFTSPTETTVADAVNEGHDLTEEASASAPATCRNDETTIFSCTVENGKTLSVCASDRLVEYRYGSDTAELVLADGQWASVPYAGGGEAQIAFDNGDTRYVVFSRIVRTNFEEGEPNYPAISDGVLIQRVDDVLGVQVCGAGELMPIQVFEAEKHLSKADDLFTFETGRADSVTRR